jgi:hypothetical protein
MSVTEQESADGKTYSGSVSQLGGTENWSLTGSE